MGDIYIVVCSTLARITIGWMKKLVDEVGSTVSNRNLCWVFATGGTITKVDLSEKLIIFHCRMSTIQNNQLDQSVPHLNAGTRVVGIFVTAAPTKRYQPSKSWSSPNTGSDFGVL